MTSATHESGLPQYVGYADIEKAFLIDRRTIQRLKREGRFPREVSLPGRKGGPVAFRLADVLAWDDTRRTHLEQRAAADPECLSPERAAETAKALVARLAAPHLGEHAKPGNVMFGIAVPISLQEVARRRVEAALSYERMFDLLSEHDALLLMAYMAPQLRMILTEDHLPRGGELQCAAVHILLELWEVLAVAHAARGDPVAHPAALPEATRQ